MIFFPAEIYYSGRHTVTDIVSNRLVVRISTKIWDYAIHASGLISPGWQKNIIILSVDAVSVLDLQGHLERMAQISWIEEAYQGTMLDCRLMELRFSINQFVEERYTKSPSPTSALIPRAVEYIQKHYIEPSLTVAFLTKNIFISREHLSRTFKEYTMEGIRGYIDNLRMQHFHHDIATGHSILDACTNNGSASYNSFLKSFRNLCGMTSTQHRTQLSSIEKRSLNTYNP